MHRLGKNARLRVIEVADRVGGVHIGGIFSIIDFLLTFMEKYYITSVGGKARLKSKLPEFIMSKGHCYLAQLAALDALLDDDVYCSKYLSEGSTYFGHPKRDEKSEIFLVSSGALGQGITMSNGVALANQILQSDAKTWCVIGDGEFNEGSCQEAIAFISQHQLNTTIVIDNNKQESLDFTGNIASNGDIRQRIEAFSIQYFDVDGHNSAEMITILDEIDLSNGPVFLNLNTIKGKGVSFMEKNVIWHSRRFKDDEMPRARSELMGD